MEANTTLKRPAKISVALYMLYISLGISVTIVIVTWLSFGAPGLTDYYLINSIMMIAALHFRTPEWIGYGGLLVPLILRIALWLYYHISRGKNWARTTLLSVYCDGASGSGSRC